MGPSVSVCNTRSNIKHIFGVPLSKKDKSPDEPSGSSGNHRLADIRAMDMPLGVPSGRTGRRFQPQKALMIPIKAIRTSRPDDTHLLKNRNYLKDILYCTRYPSS